LEYGHEFVSVGSATTTTITGLSPVTFYTFRVAAENAYGLGEYSSPSFAKKTYGPPDPPGAPRTDRISNSSVLVLWETPNGNGASVLEYAVRRGLPMGFLRRRFTVGVADDAERAFERAASLFDDGGTTPASFDPKASALVQGDLQLILNSDTYPSVEKLSSHLTVATTRQYQIKLTVTYGQVPCFFLFFFRSPYTPPASCLSLSLPLSSNQ
jgi:hypothetical protein